MGFSPGEFFRSNKGFRLRNCVSTQPRSHGFFRFLASNYCDETFSNFEHHMGHLT